MEQYRKFLSYVIPSVLAFALSGVYAIVDGFFVGNRVGDVGLSAINVAYPVVSLIQSLGTGIGMGGAVLYSIRLAMGEKEKANIYMDAAIQLLLGLSILITIGISLLLTPILQMLGAEKELLVMGKDYIRIIVLGAVFQIFGTGLLPLIRNNNGAAFAMLTMILGFGSNIFLDYLFVWRLEWGIAGAAMATVIGQGITMLGSLCYLWRHHLPMGRFSKESFALYSKIVRISLAPFVINLSPILSLIFINRSSMAYGGELAVACYACISYMITILYYFMQGVGDGSQPLMSQYYGERNLSMVKQIRRYAYLFSMLLTLMGAGILFWGRAYIGVMFGASTQVSQMVADAIPIFLVGLFFLSFARIITASFYAMANTAFSYILVYAEPVFLWIFLLILPKVGGQTYIWWSAAIAQLFTAVTAFFLKCHADRKIEKMV